MHICIDTPGIEMIQTESQEGTLKGYISVEGITVLHKFIYRHVARNSIQAGDGWLASGRFDLREWLHGTHAGINTAVNIRQGYTLNASYMSSGLVCDHDRLIHIQLVLEVGVESHNSFLFPGQHDNFLVRCINSAVSRWAKEELTCLASASSRRIRST